jgi:hypothetical protein
MPYDREELFREILGHDGGFSHLIKEKPLLAHYTSIDVAEKILKEEKIWLSNPLFMNDLQELRYGVKLGAELLFKSPELLDACGSEDRKKILENAFIYHLTQFEGKDALDVYVFCLSEIGVDDTDGQLHMWRGYGSEGNGAAIVFNTKHIINEGDDRKPLLIVKVDYVTQQQRELLIKAKVKLLCEKIKNGSPLDEQLNDYAYIFFQAIKLLALMNKHKGFDGEREWRVIYLKESASIESKKDKFEFGYFIGEHGIQPKLIFDMAPEEGEDRTFEAIIERIILGPSVSTYLAKHSFIRMLECIGRPELKSKVVTSEIPLRPKTFVS